jgi:hypothetical protein
LSNAGVYASKLNAASTIQGRKISIYAAPKIPVFLAVPDILKRLLLDIAHYFPGIAAGCNISIGPDNNFFPWGKTFLRKTIFLLIFGSFILIFFAIFEKFNLEVYAIFLRLVFS